MIGLTAWSVNHHHNHKAPVDAKRLQAGFTVGFPRVFAGDRETGQHFLGNDQIQPVLTEIGGALGRAESNHDLNVYVICRKNQQTPYAFYCPSIDPTSSRRYGSPVTVNPVAGFGDPKTTRRTSATKTIAGAFFVPAMSCHGGCARETERSAGFRVSRFANLRTVASNDRLATVGGGSTTHTEHHPMKHDPALNPSALRQRAAAHRAMALAALRANSSLSIRLKRYNDHMAKARALETKASATPTRNPRTALSWIKSGQSVRIDALNLPDHLRHIHALAALEAAGGEA